MFSRFIGGIIMVALGIAIAVYVPPFMLQSAADASAITPLDRAAWREAKLGSEFLVFGKVSNRNKTFEKGIVIGQRQRWKEQEDGEYGWSYDLEFRQRLLVDVRGVGRMSVKLDSPGVTGGLFEEKTDTTRWSGILVAQRIVVPAVIKTLDPIAAVQKPGETIFVGSPDEWREQQKKTAEMMTYIFWAMGGIFILGGAFTVVTAPFRRKS